MSGKAINSRWIFDPPKAGYHYTFPPEPCRIVKILNPPFEQVNARTGWRTPKLPYVVDVGGCRMYACDDALLPLDVVSAPFGERAPADGNSK